MGTLKYLKEREWSMGNGQCPECCGCPADWLGHPLHLNGDDLGHDKDCKLALSLVELGETPLFKGDMKGVPEYEQYITDSGILSTRLKTITGCLKLKKINDDIFKNIELTMMRRLEP